MTMTTSTSSVVRGSPYAFEAIEPTVIHGARIRFNPGAKIASGLALGITNEVAQRRGNLQLRPVGILCAQHRRTQRAHLLDGAETQLKTPLQRKPTQRLHLLGM